ncbi:MAG: sugar phosphate isomerase/epimerase [Clostridia bacterium]|nr:sugar phosphate isomerase/epimerase [Clostridia bacterium]
MKNSIIMHINYAEISGGNLGKRSVDDVCRAAAEFGFDGIEFRGAIPKSLGDISFREYADAIAAGKKKYGLKEILFGFLVGGASSSDAEERERSIAETIEKAYIAHSLCGTTLCNTMATWTTSAIPTVPNPGYEFHGSAAASCEVWNMTADAYARIAKELERIGVRFAFETHMGYVHDLATTAKKLVDAIDSPMIGVNLDYGNSVYFPKPPSLDESISLLGDKLFYTHMKNSVAVPGANGLRLPTALSEGVINHRLYVEKLAEVGFAGPIGIEAPRPGDRYHYAKSDLAYIKSVIADLK